MEPYERLANAVVLQAVKDWRMAVKKLKRGKKNYDAERIKEQTEEFFLSNRFSYFTLTDGRALLEKLKKEEGI